MDNHRSHQRFSFETDVEIDIGNEEKIPGVMINISTGGAFVKTEQPLQFGTKVTFTFVLPGVPDKCIIPAIVRWNKQDEGVGLQFESLRPIEVWAINRLKRATNKPG